MKSIYFACFFLLISSLSAADYTERDLLQRTRQLTFEGKRAGEGYFSSDGSWMVFQSERSAENPFYQIYLMDLETGDIERVSPGHGKTTCSWIHPDKTGVLYASTHLDPDARKKQKEELEMRASGKERRYSWDYDEFYDLFAKDLKTGEQKRLTTERGYDAEASYSPDGQWIAFSSNRHAYTQKMSKRDAETFKIDKSFMLDIYIMRADGSDVRRLTDVKGYDGGPFFNAAGDRICWRRFSEDGATAEIYSMNIDGSDQRQLTRIGAMSWAPYFHPSGDYLIFATNKHGFGNFELYLVDAAGKKEPVRVTDTEGFDGLPVFSPDGNTLSWTSNRTAAKQSQIFMAGWNDALARELLGLSARNTTVKAADLSNTRDGIAAADLRRHVTHLASEAMNGRLTGSTGEHMATEYVASVFKALGLQPDGENGGWYQEFPFIAGVSLGEGNKLEVNGRNFTPDKDWRPLAFSKTGEVNPAPVVFAGYGLVAPAQGDLEEYDSYVHLDVKDKWVLIFNFLPEDVPQKRRNHLTRYSGVRYKATMARNKGALGLLVANGPNTEVRQELIKLAFDTSVAGTSFPGLSIGASVRDALTAGSDKDFSALQKKLDAGEMIMGFELEGVKLGVEVDVVKEKSIGRNVVARLFAGDSKGKTALAVGAHVDHLGRGQGGSLARDEERGGIHYGADDNASGVSGLLEIAQHLASQKRAGKLNMKHDLLFAAWSGEELGLLGSNYFAANYGGKQEQDSLTPGIIAYLNMDMIGRLKDSLVVQGLGSSPAWAGVVERRNAPVGLSITTQNDSYLPTDATAFFLKKVPILSAFTGSHEDYHTPRDTAEKLNYAGMKDVARFMGLVARDLVQSADAPEYTPMKRPENSQRRAVMRAYLGTIPDYAQSETPGLKLSGVAEDGPAAKAGVKGGDIIVELAGKKVENIYDYTYAIEALKVGKETTIVVMRGKERLTMKLTPASRQ
ncbi:MAG: M28 family peptidase [Acidobacteriota bacterium]|nr:M28 family peptidase [Acidobacteriota bacterium]